MTAIPNIDIIVKKYDVKKYVNNIGSIFWANNWKFNEWGRYVTSSEVIREGLRLVDEREQKTNILREAIEAGERSGYVKDFDPVKHLEKLNQGK